MRPQADAHRFRLAFVAFPVRAQVETSFIEDAAQARPRTMASGIGAPMLDLLPALRRARAKWGESLFHHICHSTTFGHTVIAAEILRFLQQDVD